MLILDIDIPTETETGCYTLCLYRECNEELNPDGDFTTSGTGPVTWITGYPDLVNDGSTANGNDEDGVALSQLDIFPQVGCDYIIHLTGNAGGDISYLIVSSEPELAGFGTQYAVISAGDFDETFTITAETKNLYITAVSGGIDNPIAFSLISIQCDNCPVILACSECIEVDEHCNSTLVRYRNNEDSMGFEYPSGYYNQVRMPLILKEPQFPATQTVYRDAAGNTFMLNSFVEDERTIETDWMVDEMHLRTQISLRHDLWETFDEDLQDFVGWVAQPEYKIDWKRLYLKGKAETKVKRSVFDNVNTNCTGF